MVIRHIPTCRECGIRSSHTWDPRSVRLHRGLPARLVPARHLVPVSAREAGFPRVARYAPA